MNLYVDPTIQDVEIDRSGEEHRAVLKNPWAIKKRGVAARTKRHGSLASHLNWAPPESAWLKRIFSAGKGGSVELTARRTPIRIDRAPPQRWGDLFKGFRALGERSVI